MKVAVYAVELSGEWVTKVSLSLTVDEWWWAGEGGDVEGWNSCPADRMVLLSRSMPLGWAVKLAGTGRFTVKTQSWKEEDWRKYATAILKAEIRAEREAGGQREGWPFEEIEVWRLDSNEWAGGRETGQADHRRANVRKLGIGNTLGSLAAGADRLTEAFEGALCLRAKQRL